MPGSSPTSAHSDPAAPEPMDASDGSGAQAENEVDELATDLGSVDSDLLDDPPAIAMGDLPPEQNVGNGAMPAHADDIGVAVAGVARIDVGPIAPVTPAQDEGRVLRQRTLAITKQPGRAPNGAYPDDDHQEFDRGGDPQDRTYDPTQAFRPGHYQQSTKHIRRPKGKGVVPDQRKEKGKGREVPGKGCGHNGGDGIPPNPNPPDSHPHSPQRPPVMRPPALAGPSNGAPHHENAVAGPSSATATVTGGNGDVHVLEDIDGMSREQLLAFVRACFGDTGGER